MRSLLFALLAVACGSSSETTIVNNYGLDAGTETGGTAIGGKSSVIAVPATGGMHATGGDISTSGSAATGGTMATGGTSAPDRSKCSAAVQEGPAPIAMRAENPAAIDRCWDPLHPPAGLAGSVGLTACDSCHNWCRIGIDETGNPLAVSFLGSCWSCPTSLSADQLTCAGFP